MAGVSSLDFVDRVAVEPARSMWPAADPPGPSEQGLARPPRISLVIPTLNEERNVAWVVDRIPAMVDEIILADGRSTDRTIEVARAVRPDIIVVYETTPGKGAALRTAFGKATGEIIVMLDADCSMDPEEIPRFIDAIQGGADFAKGSRFLPGGGSVDISMLRKVGNRTLLRLTNTLFRARFTELCYGFMAFRRNCLPALALKSTGFEIETELVVRALTVGLRVAEVPSFEAARRYGTSNLRTFRDGWRVANTVISSRLRQAAERRAGQRILDDAQLASWSPRDLDAAVAVVAGSAEESQVGAEA